MQGSHLQRRRPRVPRELRAYNAGADLDEDEQYELAVKVRLGIGAAQLDAIADTALALTEPRSPVVPPREQAPRLRPGSKEAVHGAVQRLGRGYGMGRTWRR